MKNTIEKIKEAIEQMEKIPELLTVDGGIKTVSEATSFVLSRVLDLYNLTIQRGSADNDQTVYQFKGKSEDILKRLEDIFLGD